MKVNWIISERASALAKIRKPIVPSKSPPTMTKETVS